jgi:hypothetical protein
MFFPFVSTFLKPVWLLQLTDVNLTSVRILVAIACSTEDPQDDEFLPGSTKVRRQAACRGSEAVWPAVCVDNVIMLSKPEWLWKSVYWNV